MEARTIMKIRLELTRFLRRFDHCFGRVTTRRYLDQYLEGQLSDLPRKKTRAGTIIRRCRHMPLTVRR